MITLLRSTEIWSVKLCTASIYFRNDEQIGPNCVLISNNNFKSSQFVINTNCDALSELFTIHIENHYRNTTLYLKFYAYFG